MPKIDITNPDTIKFLIENYEKESRLRLNWIGKNREKIQEAATLQREPTNYYETDVIKENIKGGLATITRDHAVAACNRRKVPIRDATFVPGVKNLRKGYSLVDIGLGDPKQDPRLARPDTDLTPDPVMLPVDPKLKEIIYKPKPVFGRVVYLEKRTKIKPEKRYYLPQAHNWDYGWRMGDSKLKNVPEFGRCWRLMRALRTRVGPQVDPPHYRSSEPPGPSKCT